MKHFHVLNMLIAIFSITISLVKKYLDPPEIITVDQADFLKRFSFLREIHIFEISEFTIKPPELSFRFLYCKP